VTHFRRALPLLLALAAIFCSSARAAAQNVCELVYQTGNWVSVGAESQRVINASGPLLVRCTNGEELRADSAVLYEAINEVHLFRRVARFDERAAHEAQGGQRLVGGSLVADFADLGFGETVVRTLPGVGDDLVDVRAMRKRRGLEHQFVDEAEHRGVHADAECEGDEGSKRETRRLQERTEGVFHG
jgi:hypothetical protein